MSLQISYRKGNLFKNLREDVLYLHACNSQNIWGAGISLEFRKYFPKAYNCYKLKINNPGDGYIVCHNNFRIACLITSKFYGKFKDPPKKIIIQTHLALNNLLHTVEEKKIIIYSPKINSGFFNVPWELTEKIIQHTCDNFCIDVIRVVWELM